MLARHPPRAFDRICVYHLSTTHGLYCCDRHLHNQSDVHCAAGHHPDTYTDEGKAGLLKVESMFGINVREGLEGEVENAKEERRPAAAPA